MASRRMSKGASTWKPRDTYFTSDHTEPLPSSTSLSHPHSSYSQPSLSSACPITNTLIPNNSAASLYCGQLDMWLHYSLVRTSTCSEIYPTTYILLAAPSFGLVREIITEAPRILHPYGTPKFALHINGCPRTAEVALDFLVSLTAPCPT